MSKESSRVVLGLRIERGVPLPPIQGREGHNILLLKAMEVGDSIFFDAPVVKRAVRFYRVAKKLGIHIIIRKDGKNGVRMWRVDSPPEGESEKLASKMSAKGKAKKAAQKVVAKAAKTATAKAVKVV